MKNWVIILIIFVVPLGLYGFLSARTEDKAEAGMVDFLNPIQIKMAVDENKKEASLPKLYSFHTPLCGECKEQEKELRGLENEFEGQIFFKTVEVSGLEGKKREVKNLIKRYNIQVTPTIVITKANGDVIKKYDHTVKRAELEKILNDVALNESKRGE